MFGAGGKQVEVPGRILDGRWNVETEVGNIIKFLSFILQLIVVLLPIKNPNGYSRAQCDYP